jgi:hypothetical protein
MWKVMGQHLFLNIIPNNFMMARTGWKVWCDRDMSLRNNQLMFETLGENTHHFRGIYRMYLKYIKKTGRCKQVSWLDLESLGSWPTMSKTFQGTVLFQTKSNKFDCKREPSTSSATFHQERLYLFVSIRETIPLSGHLLWCGLAICDIVLCFALGVPNHFCSCQ